MQLNPPDTILHGSDAEFFINGEPFHSRLTSINENDDSIIGNRQFLSERRTKNVVIIDSGTISLQSKTIRDDQAVQSIFRSWNDSGNQVQIGVLGENNFHVGQSGMFFCINGTGKSRQFPEDDFQTYTLDGSILVKENFEVQSFDLQAGEATKVYDPTSRSYTGTSANAVVADGVVNTPNAADKTIIVWYSVRPISGFGNLTGAKRWRISFLNDTSNDTIGISKWHDMTNQFTYTIATASLPTVSGYDKICVELDLGQRPAGQTNYNLNIKADLCYAFVGADIHFTPGNHPLVIGVGNPPPVVLDGTNNHRKTIDLDTYVTWAGGMTHPTITYTVANPPANPTVSIAGSHATFSATTPTGFTSPVTINVSATDGTTTQTGTMTVQLTYVAVPLSISTTPIDDHSYTAALPGQIIDLSTHFAVNRSGIQPVYTVTSAHNSSTSQPTVEISGSQATMTYVPANGAVVSPITFTATATDGSETATASVNQNVSYTAPPTPANPLLNQDFALTGAAYPVDSEWELNETDRNGLRARFQPRFSPNWEMFAQAGGSSMEVRLVYSGSPAGEAEALQLLNKFDCRKVIVTDVDDNEYELQIYGLIRLQPPFANPGEIEIEWRSTTITNPPDTADIRKVKLALDNTSRELRTSDLDGYYRHCLDHYALADQDLEDNGTYDAGSVWRLEPTLVNGFTWPAWTNDDYTMAAFYEAGSTGRAEVRMYRDGGTTLTDAETMFETFKGFNMRIHNRDGTHYDMEPYSIDAGYAGSTDVQMWWRNDNVASPPNNNDIWLVEFIPTTAPHKIRSQTLTSRDWWTYPPTNPPLSFTANPLQAGYRFETRNTVGGVWQYQDDHTQNRITIATGNTSVVVRFWEQTSHSTLDNANATRIRDHIKCLGVKFHSSVGESDLLPAVAIERQTEGTYTGFTYIFRLTSTSDAENIVDEALIDAIELVEDHTDHNLTTPNSVTDTITSCPGN